MDLSISLLFLSTSSKCLNFLINSIMCLGMSYCSRNLAFLPGATCLYISMYALVELQWLLERNSSRCYPNTSLNLYYQNLKGLGQTACIISNPKMWILIILHKEKLDKLLLTAWLQNRISVIKYSIYWTVNKQFICANSF